MKIRTNKTSEDFIINTNKQKIPRDINAPIPSDLVVPKPIKYKAFRKCGKSLPNFITSKNKIFLKSFLDHKGTKKFLAEKEKAMEELILEDKIVEEKKIIKKASNSCTKQKNSKNKKITKNIHSKYYSHNEIIHLDLKNNFNHNKNSQDKHRNNKFELKATSSTYINNITDIGKINQKNKKKKASIESIRNNLSNFNQKEPSYLFTGENDSFLYSILNLMSNTKN